MIKRILQENWQWSLLWLLFLLASLYSRPPLPVDETRYLSVAWEMWQSNHFLVPCINGVPYSHKPPLLFWLIHFGWWLFGVNEWSARLTAPLFAFASMLLSSRLAARLWPGDRNTARLVPWILLGTLYWSLFSSLTMFDMLMVFFSLVALHGLLQVRAGNRGRGWAMVGLAIGLGILAKGPVILVYVLPPVLLAPWWLERDAAVSLRSWYPGFLSALVGGAVLALAWVLPAARAGGPEYAQAILFGQTAGRMVHSFAHQRPFWWYLPLLPLLLFPWPIYPPCWRGCRCLSLSRPVRFCLSAVVPVFLALSCISGKQVHYLLPLLPPASLLFARGINRLDRISVLDRWLPIAVFLLLALVLPFLHLTAGRTGDGVLLAQLPAWLGLGPLLLALLLIFIRSVGPAEWLKLLGSGLVLLLVFWQLVLRKPLYHFYDATPVAEKIHEVQERGLLVAAYPARLRDQFQFRGRLTRPLVPVLTLEEEVVWAYHNKQQFCLIYIENGEHSWLLDEEGIKKRYKNGWLIVRSATTLYDEYLEAMKKGR